MFHFVFRLFDVPVVCEVHVVPSDEVSNVPEAPTAINNPEELSVLLLELSVESSEVVVVMELSVASSSISEHEESTNVILTNSKSQ